MIVSASDPIIGTASGIYVTPLDLQPEHVRIEDIAHHLSNQCRFSGAVREFYSVAQHSVLVSRVVEAGFALDGLMHDASEAYLQDVARPLKEDADFGRAYREAEDRAAEVIANVFDLTYPHPRQVKIADLILLATERRDLMPPYGEWEILEGVPCLSEIIQPWSPRRARRKFMQRYQQLTG